MRLHSRRVDVSELHARDRAEMFALFARHYDRTDRDRFESDLNRKHWVIQLFDPATERLCGFSTQVLLKVHRGNGTIHALYSGDTIVDPACWTETLLMRQWGRLVVDLIAQTRPEPLYWFLTSKGYKTYRFLPVFFREFYPRYDCDTPAWAKQVLDVLGQSLFEDAYDLQRGLVIATPHKDRLRAGVADVTTHRLEDPHVRFFVQRNPGYPQGDDICCLAPLDTANFTPAGIRLLDPANRPEQGGQPGLKGTG